LFDAVGRINRTARLDALYDAKHIARLDSRYRQVANKGK
jgi:hypothetical protein